ncbi:hypothetical protein EJ03DRAFT_3013 [Teratosphaeria nubilosa]|uniref:F-box domain-containing protein n=1 Tax=Teratosphaeria nubilosa TaxID=161662 RepID=A0A6G1LP80_9PEZI|nr:hypothetical protein EJ03DRAFT_3013 [Teratosphaeria nubilosa]
MKSRRRTIGIYLCSAKLCSCILVRSNDHFIDSITSMSKAILKQQPPSPLLNLPPELRNAIYDHLAYSSKVIEIQSGDKISTQCAPLAGVCRQLRQEFSSAYQAITLAYADNITVHNINLSAKPLLLTLSTLPGPAETNLNRSVTIKILLTNELQTTEITAFVTYLAAPSPLPKSAGAHISYDVSFDPNTFNLYSFRITFARLAKRYRFHKCDAEQRVWEQVVWEQVYWAFAKAAERVDGVSVGQYALGQWRGSGGGICFV